MYFQHQEKIVFNFCSTSWNYLELESERPKLAEKSSSYQIGSVYVARGGAFSPDELNQNNGAVSETLSLANEAGTAKWEWEEAARTCWTLFPPLKEEKGYRPDRRLIDSLKDVSKNIFYATCQVFLFIYLFFTI